MKDKSSVEKNKEANGVKRTKIVVGLDIGTTKIACFVGKKNEHGKIEILSMGKSESLGVMRGVVANIQKTIQSINAAVKETQDRVEGDLIISNVNVGIAGQHIKSLQHKGIYTRSNTDTEINQSDVDALISDMMKMVMNPGEEIITVLPQEYIVDNEPGIKDPIGMAGVRLEANFHIITGHISNVMNIRRCVEQAGLRIKSVILEPIASADAVLNDEEKEAGVVLVDIGGGTTDVAIFHEGLIRHTAVIPFGGNVITDDIKEGCMILRRHAETLKVKYGSAFASENKEQEVVCIPGLRGQNSKEITLKSLSEIIQARMEEIIDLVKFEIDNSGYKRKMIAGIVVTGGGAQMQHLTQLFEYCTGMDTRIGYPTEHLASSNPLDLLASPMFSTGIGLVLKGFENDTKGHDDVVSNASEVVGHSEGVLKGKFFNTIFPKMRAFFEEEEV